jgi:hypothetical protein
VDAHSKERHARDARYLTDPGSKCVAEMCPANRKEQRQQGFTETRSTFNSIFRLETDARLL